MTAATGVIHDLAYSPIGRWTSYNIRTSTKSIGKGYFGIVLVVGKTVIARVCGVVACGDPYAMC